VRERWEARVRSMNFERKLGSTRGFGLGGEGEMLLGRFTLRGGC